MPSHAPSAIPALRSTLSPSKCGRLGEKEESWAVKNKGDAILRCVGIALIVGKVHSVGGPPARVRDKRRESRAFMEEETLQAPRRAVHPNLPATSLNTFHVLDVMCSIPAIGNESEVTFYRDVVFAFACGLNVHQVRSPTSGYGDDVSGLQFGHSLLHAFPIDAYVSILHQFCGFGPGHLERRAGDRIDPCGGFYGSFGVHHGFGHLQFAQRNGDKAQVLQPPLRPRVVDGDAPTRLPLCFDPIPFPAPIRAHLDVANEASRGSHAHARRPRTVPRTGFVPVRLRHVGTWTDVRRRVGSFRRGRVHHRSRPWPGCVSRSIPPPSSRVAASRNRRRARSTWTWLVLPLRIPSEPPVWPLPKQTRVSFRSCTVLTSISLSSSPHVDAFAPCLVRDPPFHAARLDVHVDPKGNGFPFRTRDGSPWDWGGKTEGLSFRNEGRKGREVTTRTQWMGPGRPELSPWERKEAW
eukprot:scaffold113_cov339-Pavlova_lutheri.AAC.46